MNTDKVRDEKTKNNEDRQNVEKVTEILYKEKATQTDDRPVQTTKETTVKDKKKKKGKEDENNGDKQNLKLLDESKATHSDDPPKTTTTSENIGKKNKKKNKKKEKNDNANDLENVTQLLAQTKISHSKNPPRTTITFETISKNKKKKNKEIDDITNTFIELTEEEAKATVSFGGPPITLTPEQIERRKEKVRKFNQYPLNFERFVELLELAKTNVYRPTLPRRTAATTSSTAVLNKNYNKDEEKKTTFDLGTGQAKDKVYETSTLPASDLPPKFISRVQRSLKIQEELDTAVKQVLKNTNEVEDMVNKMLEKNKKRDNKIN